MYEAISDWASGVIAERQIFFKIVCPAGDDDLTYYLILHIVRCHEVCSLVQVYDRFVHPRFWPAVFVTLVSLVVPYSFSIFRPLGCLPSLSIFTES